MTVELDIITAGASEGNPSNFYRLQIILTSKAGRPTIGSRGRESSIGGSWRPTIELLLGNEHGGRVSWRKNAAIATAIVAIVIFHLRWRKCAIAA